VVSGLFYSYLIPDTLSYLKGRVTTLLGRGEAVVVSARLRGLSGVPDFG
jgi:hypothetical protein